MKAAQILLAANLIVATIAPAAAQSRLRQYDAFTAAPPYSGRSVGRDGRVCQQLCVADTTPCDPPEYKIADGRCNDPFRRW